MPGLQVLIFDMGGVLVDNTGVAEKPGVGPTHCVVFEIYRAGRAGVYCFG